MANLKQRFDCEISDRFMSCKVENGYLEIGIWNCEEEDDVSIVSIGYSQVANLIEYLEGVKAALFLSIGAMEINTSVQEYVGAVTQLDSVTCQSVCVHAVIDGEMTVDEVRSELVKFGEAGSPENMARLIKRFIPADRHSMTRSASLKQIRDWLKGGAVIITHGYFTRWGHVIILDGWSEDQGFNVMDPWAEFDGPSWRYIIDRDRSAYDGYYSEKLIYASCVESNSYDEAIDIYNSRGAIDENLAVAWCNVVFPKLAVK